ncbi:MAG: phosphopyruvate hydratase [Casimicrobiaceae bacterium]
MSATTIRHIRGRQILDSRGRPTVEVDVMLAGGATGRAAVPSGASTGAAEAHELRDGDPGRYAGLGVLQAVANVDGEIARAIAGQDALDQRGVDARLRALDGTESLQRLGANAVLGVSLAVARAAAAVQSLPLHAHIAALAGNSAPGMPLPMVNILSGGLHAGRGMDIQDFLAIPARAMSIEDAIHTMACVRSAAAAVVADAGLSTLLADEGGLSPGCETPEAALDMMLRAIERAGYRPGEDVVIAIDVAASALVDDHGGYRLARENRTLTADAMIAMVEGWVARYPVASIEDALAEEDWEGWRALTARLGTRVQLVGDDLFTTHRERLARGIAEGIGNGVLVKLNQNGTLTGTLDVIAQAKAGGYATIVSARSGETEDPFIADLAVGASAGQIKIGSLRTSSTVGKYNQLLRIAAEGGAPFAGLGVLAGRR